MNRTVPGFPEKGLSRKEILAAMEEARGQDFNWRAGRLFSTVYPVDQEIYELLKEAFNLFFTENGLNPTVFPSLRKFENEVVAMTAAMLHLTRAAVRLLPEKVVSRMLSGAFVIFFALQVLGWFGYQAPPEGATQFSQSPATLTAIRWLTGPVPAFILVCVIVVTWFYPLTRERHARIRRLLQQKKERTTTP